MGLGLMNILLLYTRGIIIVKYTTALFMLFQVLGDLPIS